MKFQPHICTECRQTTDYPIALDKGTTFIVIALSNAVRIKGENNVHLVREMLCNPKDFKDYKQMVGEGKMSIRMIDNILKAKYHGLVAQADENGYYLFTPKGAKFLRNKPVPRIAIIDKVTHSKREYLNEFTDLITAGELLKKDSDFWETEQAKIEQFEMFKQLETRQLTLI